MTLQTGQMLSQYRLTTKIGEGGMGVVWKGLDTSLNREVAIKVLPDVFAADPDRLARFEREARLLASLNHPGIAIIHGLHHAEGIRFLAMEFLPGEDLAHRLLQGPVPIDEALSIALQVAAALEAAHESGVIHRDLKPANILIGPENKVKVLDFGLAKAFEPDPMSASGSISPTLTTPATRAGVIMGTAAYMSPEQAKAKNIDRRADIWAFGCVLYEMLTGRRPFSGDGVSEILAAVIMSPPELQLIPSSVPFPIRRLVRRCLEKDPRKRLRDIGEARLVIEETLAGTFEEPSHSAATAVVVKRRGVAVITAIGLLAAAAIGAGLFRLMMPSPGPAPLRRFELASKGPYRSGVLGNLLAVSPDGTRVAFSTDGKIWIRTLDRLEAKQVTVTGEPGFLFWSPDSGSLGFAAGGKIWKTSPDGGESKIIVDQPGTLTGGSGGTWGAGGRIVYARGDDGLYEVPATGGDVKTLLKSEPGARGDFHQPSYLPGDSGVLFVFHPNDAEPNTLSLYSGGVRKDLLKIAGQYLMNPVYSSTGHILYRRQPNNSGVWAVPFSLTKKEITGEPFLVVPDGDVQSVSSDGTLIYGSGSFTRTTKMVWVDRTGKVVGTIGQPQEQWPFPALSPDGRQVAISATENEKREIWIHDAERGTMTRLTFGSAQTWAPAWSPKGDRIVFDEGGGPPFEIMTVASDGGGEARKMGSGWGSAFTPDGKYILTASMDPNNSWDLWYLDADKVGTALPLLKTNGVQTWPRVSPDGRYVAYNSDETGRTEVYVKRFPGGEGKWQVSVDGGSWPRWGHHGDRIYYTRGDTIMEAELSTGASPTLGKPHELFTRMPLGWPLIFGWPPGFDVSPDDKRFVICQPVDAKQPTAGIVLVENWFTEFARK